MEGLQRRLDHAMNNARVHLYVDAVKNINQSPYVLLRQAILCSLLHHLDLLSTQLGLMQRQHKENVEAMISSALEIDNALVECDVNLLTLISEALESLRAVESRGLRMKLFLHSNQIEQCCLDDRSMIGERVRCQLQEQVHGKTLQQDDHKLSISIDGPQRIFSLHQRQEDMHESTPGMIAAKSA